MFMKLQKLDHPPSPATSANDVEGDRLRDHLQNALSELPNDLPTYNKEQLLDDLCFILRSPLYLYAMAPRLRRAERAAETSRIRMLTPKSTYSGISSPEAKREPNDGIDTQNLIMDIQWSGECWVTRLLYGESMLVEGRQRASRKAGFVHSFRWFCDEARFLCYEFSAREHAATVRLGTVMDAEPLETPKGAVKKTRIVKLKIRPTRVLAGYGASK